MATPRTSALGLPPRYRRHALARLDALIARTESDRAERLRAVEHLIATGKGTARARARLRTAEYRLALLRGSRPSGRSRMRLLPILAAGGLLLAASSLATSAAGLGPTAVAGGDARGTTLPGSPLPRRHPSVAQTPGTNPPDRDECRKLAAAAQVRELDDGERDRLGLCLATRRDGSGPALETPEADPLGRERQG